MKTNAQSFPVGYHSFHKEKVINFQLNRRHSLGLLPFGEVKSAREEITGYEDWKSILVGYAERALEENRLMDAAFFFRAAHFFVHTEDPDNERQGYDIIVFDGPGQGNAQRTHGLVFDYQWEKTAHADMHCQVGNVGLALQTMHEWIDSHPGQDAIS